MLTEELHPLSRDIDNLTAEEIVTLMNNEDKGVVETVGDASGAICKAVNDAIKVIQGGGSLVYVGAGTSGRLGVLDASEMPPTFGVSPVLVRAIIAGGEGAVTKAVEGVEDDEIAGRASVSLITEEDMVLGISASGRTPFVLSALRECKSRGARCHLLTCNTVAYDFLDGIIILNVGPEIIAGSTRLKAGTATKMVLNMISTTAMIKTGRVYRGYMIDVIPSSEKLRRRALRIIKEVTNCSSEEAERYLNESRGSAKRAVLMYVKGLGYEEAEGVLKRSGGSLREALKIC